MVQLLIDPLLMWGSLRGSSLKFLPNLWVREYPVMNIEWGSAENEGRAWRGSPKTGNRQGIWLQSQWEKAPIISSVAPASSTLGVVVVVAVDSFFFFNQFNQVAFEPAVMGTCPSPDRIKSNACPMDALVLCGFESMRASVCACACECVHVWEREREREWED